MNVTLRLIKEEDLPLIQKYLSIEDVSRMTNVPEPYPLTGAKEWYDLVLEEHHAENHYPFAIIAVDEFAGSISVRREQGDIGAIDYWVAPPSSREDWFSEREGISDCKWRKAWRENG